MHDNIFHQCSVSTSLWLSLSVQTVIAKQKHLFDFEAIITIEYQMQINRKCNA